VADPPLQQVVSRSGEMGVRGFVGDAARPLLRMSAAGFITRNFDDILFVAGSRVGTGYFRNAGETQRLGLEIDMSGEAGPLRFFASYALLRATFESDLALPGGANPGLTGREDPAAEGDKDEDDGEGPALAVGPGDRIPGLPEHSFKAGVSLSPLPRWEIGVSLIARSGAPYRGDEANLIDNVPGYATLGAYTSYQLLDQLQVFLKGQNLLDTEYETFGVLADPSEVLPGTRDPRFVGPGAPLAVFAGLVLHDG
jgi:iron complex outermembrane receptor protein